MRFGATGGIVAVLAGPLLAGLVAADAAAQGQRYTFVNLFGTGAEQIPILGEPALNNDGTVAFTFQTDTAARRLLTTNGGPPTTIATLGPAAGDFFTFGEPGINGAGTVAFWGPRRNSGEGVYAGNGGPLTRIADTTQGFVGMTGRWINDSGAVAILGVRPGFRNSGIFVGSGGPLTTIADTSGPYSDFASVPAINNAGTVAFRADLDAGGEGIFTGNGGTVTTVMFDPGAAVGSGIGFNHPRISSAGIVAVRQAISPSRFVIVTGNGGPVTTVADSSGPYGFMSDPAINASGTVAFSAALDAGGAGVFTGPDPLADKVIVAGDQLFGSTLSAIDPTVSVGLNDGGSIAFAYSLANGTQGIALGVPVVPEPGALCALLEVGLLLRRCRRTRLPPDPDLSPRTSRKGPK